MALSPDEQSKLAHLLRRAGFGPRPGEWKEYAALGVAAATEKLLNPEKTPDHLAALLEQISGDYVDYDDLNSIRQWWLYRMVHTKRPLEEKMTLFWHNHFATANYKVDNSRRMWAQNEVFRKYGLGSFRTLLQKMTADPAMLVWLDGHENRLGKPNENYAREVMELFTMGVGSGYTEKDIQEAARAFTGFRKAGGGDFQYDPYLHDDGYKMVLGKGGNWHSDDVINILCRQPATARFLTTKLYKFFVNEDAPKAEIDKLSKVYFDSGFEIRAVLRAIFNSPAFWAQNNRFALIKSPVEFAVMTIRSLDAPMSAVRDLPSSLALMGQDLFNPPNVKGWEEGRAWINSRTLLARVNFAAQLSSEMSRRVSLLDRMQGLSAGQSEAAPAMAKPAFPKLGSSSGGGSMAAPAMGGVMEAPSMEMPAMGGPAGRQPAINMTPEAAIQTLWDGLITGMPIPPETRQHLLAYGEANNNIASRLPGLLNLIVSVPEYQLC